MTDAPLTADQVLDELVLLASIEHSVCAEYLSVHCALGHDLGPPDQSDVAQRVADAASAASTAAQGEMRHVHDVNRALVLAGRSPELGRAPSIASTSGTDIALGPLTRAQLENLAAREGDLAVAVDARYARLQPAMADLLDPLPDHSGFPEALHDSLDGIDPSHYLRATPRPRQATSRSRCST